MNTLHDKPLAVLAVLVIVEAVLVLVEATLVLTVVFR